jgi:hypothetical protein
MRMTDFSPPAAHDRLKLHGFDKLTHKTSWIWTASFCGTVQDYSLFGHVAVACATLSEQDGVRCVQLARGVSAAAADLEENQEAELDEPGQVVDDFDSENEDQEDQCRKKDDGQVWITL